MMEIKLTQGKVAIVDDEDYEWLSKFNWQAYRSQRTWYAQRYSVRADGKRATRYMHRDIMGAPGADHIDGDGLNNTRANLRIATHAQNMRNVKRRSDNTSGFKGVHWRSDCERWRAYINVDGSRKYLGYFDDILEAARAYDAAARELHGEFARLNFGEVIQ